MLGQEYARRPLRLSLKATTLNAMTLTQLVEPSHTAVVLQECQNGIIGANSGLPAMAEAARESGCIQAVARLVAAARSAGVRVIHSVFHQREDGWGDNTDLLLFKVIEESPVKLYAGSEAVQPIDEIGLDPADFVIVRHHGMSPFPASELNAVLRNEGVNTIIPAGVSVNWAITNLTFDAVNRGYDVVVPRDAVTGIPAEYVEMAIEHSLAFVSTIAATEEIVTAWS